MIVRLAPGWRLDESGPSFVAASRRNEFAGPLAGARARPHVPALAARDADALSEPERELARTVQVLLPKDADLEAARRALLELDAVEEATLSPEVGLP